MNRIELIGVAGETLDQRQLELIGSCGAVVASKRHASMVDNLGIPVIGISPLSAMIDEVREHLQAHSVAVLASGDPLFYGIGKVLLSRFKTNQIEIHPALSAVQLACARFKVAWDNMALISLHGRDGGNIAGKILRHEKALLFTDTIHTPDSIARILLTTLTETGDGNRLNSIRMSVAEDLALTSERVCTGTLEEMSKLSFSPLNMVYLEQADFHLPADSFGLTEKEINHSRGLITKDEVRAASLHKLRLPPNGVLWDVGGGSGSLSIEAARMNPELQVYIIEKKEPEQLNILANIKKYNTYNVSLIRGEAPEKLKDLPSPDRVFIGGSGGNLQQIISQAAEKLPPGGRIVANAVLAKTADEAPRYMKISGLQVQTVLLQVSRQEAEKNEIVNFNPITIITGSK